jgi:hypothetical protein
VQTLDELLRAEGLDGPSVLAWAKARGAALLAALEAADLRALLEPGADVPPPVRAAQVAPARATDAVERPAAAVSLVEGLDLDEAAEQPASAAQTDHPDDLDVDLGDFGATVELPDLPGAAETPAPLAARAAEALPDEPEEPATDGATDHLDAPGPVRTGDTAVGRAPTAPSPAPPKVDAEPEAGAPGAEDDGPMELEELELLDDEDLELVVEE